MVIAPIAAAIALGMKLVDFAKYVRAKDWNASVTQLVVWTVGALIVALLGWASLTAHLVVPGTTITWGSLNVGDVILVGSGFLSIGSKIYDWQAARDNTDSAATPALTGLSSGPAPAP